MAIKAALAPLPSMMVLVATVVPCTLYVTLRAGTFDSSRIRLMTLMKPTDGSLGVLDIFTKRISPVDSFIITASVKVPPMSTPNLKVLILKLF